MDSLTRVHCVGIGGSGVQAIAEYLLNRGVSVSGSDELESGAIHRLRRMGATVTVGHQAHQVPSDAEALIYSPAVGHDNVERVEAARRGIPQHSYPEMLGQVMAQASGVAIAGTHGKSTTTAMLGWILTAAGLDPTVVVGAEVPQLGGSSRVGQGSHFVAESCEFGRSFLELNPSVAAILNIESDHLDFFADLDEIVAGFHSFVQRIPEDGILLAQQSDPVQRAVQSAPCHVETFSLNPGCNWWAADLRDERGRYRFRIFHNGDYVTEIRLLVPGKHNVENALAAVAIACSVGVSPRAVREALEEFGGCRRRLETKGIWRGTTLVDDYAHHPTEVRASLQSAREMFGDRKMWCVFQPHQISRTRALFDEFVESFSVPDALIVTDIFAAREAVSYESAKIAKNLAEAIAKQGTETRYLGDSTAVSRHLETHLEPGDVLLTMGAGDVWKVCDEFARRLSRYRQAG